jgi:acid phosphatase class B
LKFILDIDGTLADLSERAHFAEAGDWDNFFDLVYMSEDTPIEHTQDGMKEIIDYADEIYFLTGRPERTREVTVDWLDKYYNIRPPKEILFMKTDDDHGPSSKFKKAIIEDNFGDEEDLVFVEDEPDNLEMMEEFGEVLKAPDVWKELISDEEE